MSALMCSHMSAPLCSHMCVIVIIITTTSLVSFCPPTLFGVSCGKLFDLTLSIDCRLLLYDLYIPVVPNKAVAEVSKIGNL